MLELDAIAKRYGKLPSEICDRTIEQYNLDIAIASVGIAQEKPKTTGKRPTKIPYRK